MNEDAVFTRYCNEGDIVKINYKEPLITIVNYIDWDSKVRKWRYHFKNDDGRSIYEYDELILSYTFKVQVDSHNIHNVHQDIIDRCYAIYKEPLTVYCDPDEKPVVDITDKRSLQEKLMSKIIIASNYINNRAVYDMQK